MLNRVGGSASLPLFHEDTVERADRAETSVVADEIWLRRPLCRGGPGITRSEPPRCKPVV